MSRNGFNLLRLKFGSLAFAPLCLLMTACVTSAVSAAGTRFHYSWWLPLGLFMAGLAFVPPRLFIVGVRFGSIRLALTKQSPTVWLGPRDLRRHCRPRGCPVAPHRAGHEA